MLLRLLFICLLALGPLFAQEDTICRKTRHYRHEVAIAAIFQNEARFLKEWIEYHKLIGVSHFYLYNNLSTDNYKEVLQPYINSGEVDLTNWPYKSENTEHWTKIQCSAYNKALKKAKGKVRWLAVIDSDEFILPMTHDNLGQFLEPYRKYAGVCVNWQMFGTSGVPKIETDKLLIESLYMKAEEQYGENAYVKTIVRPDKVKKYVDPHYPKFKSKSFKVNAHNERVRNSTSHIIVDRIRINHYWSRDEDYFYSVKCPRRQEWSEGFDGQLNRLNNINNVPDDAIFRFVPALRAKMGFCTEGHCTCGCSS